MQVSQTYDPSKNDHINREQLAFLCGQYLGIREVSPSLYLIAAPVSELAHYNKNGDRVNYRYEIDEAIPWDERSLKTFGVVYRYETTASFIGLDGKTYVVPNDRPVLDHLQECGYVIAPEGHNFDGSTQGDDSLIFKDVPEDPDLFFDTKIIDKNLPSEIVDKINKIEGDRPYYGGKESYASVVVNGGSFGFDAASEEELQELSLNERKMCNMKTYGRTNSPQDIEEYVQYALQQTYLSEERFKKFTGKK